MHGDEVLGRGAANGGRGVHNQLLIGYTKHPLQDRAAFTPHLHTWQICHYGCRPQQADAAPEDTTYGELCPLRGEVSGT